MKTKWIVMAFPVLILTACDQDCNPNGPDVPKYVDANGTYQRFYPVTSPEETQPAQVAFEMEGYGGQVVNATEISEGNYTFRMPNRLVTYPSGLYYTIYFFDWKAWLSDRTSQGRTITINGYTFSNPVKVDEKHEAVRCRFDENGYPHEIF